MYSSNLLSLEALPAWRERVAVEAPAQDHGPLAQIYDLTSYRFLGSRDAARVTPLRPALRVVSGERDVDLLVERLLGAGELGGPEAA